MRRGLAAGLLALLTLATTTARALTLSEVRPVQGAGAAARVPGLVATSPRPLLYFGPGDLAPSCGLLASADGRELLPMLQANPGERFPACEAVTGAQGFALPGARGHVFSLRQRDTREDVYIVHFFVLQTTQGTLQALDALNQAELPARRDLPSLASWAKAQWHAQQDSASGWVHQGAHSIVAGPLFLNLARHEGQARCRATLGLRDTAEPLLVDEWPCAAVLAASQQAAGGAQWFTVLAGDPASPQLRVYRVARDRAERMPVTEARLAPLAIRGLPAVKAALQRAPR